MARGERIRYLQGRLRAFGNLMAMNGKQKRRLTIPDREAGKPPKDFGPLDYFHDVTLAYCLSRYPGSIDAFVSEESTFSVRCYWRYLARGGVNFKHVPCGHLQLLSPEYVPTLAKSLTAVLQRAQEKDRQSKIDTTLVPS